MSSIPRFFVPPPAIQGDTITLPPDAAHHAVGVLRMREGEEIIVHDNTGDGYRCRLTRVQSKVTVATVESRFTVPTEPKTRLTVAQVLPKTGEKIEQVLQHGTEVGASGFVLFQSERSVARMEQKDKIEKRLERWQGIVQGAAEQSGRGRLPTVEWERHAPDITRRIGEWDAAIALHEGATLALRDALQAERIADATRLLILVGPEGGFTDGEVAGFAGAGATPVSLGARVLRTETAALVALAQILYARGE
ncbi:MAG: 16S rRNA (uracil(1498)-N(3))-methyltransferase [Akkermansiaceae bacterium]|nr:16S rRNA (uracil(1498)-N(3))-methyltransferase [Armatimonadota bacterium]